MTVAVIADSAASLPVDLAARWGIAVVPLQIVVDGEPHDEGAGIDAAGVVAALHSGRDATTSQPRPGAFEDALAAAVAEGAEGVVIVTLSGALSGTAEVARAAAARAVIPVEVVDTRTVAMAEGFAAVAAAQAARAGARLGDVADAARATAAGSRCFFTVDTLDFLRRGGRVSPVVAAAGRVLGIRPVLEVRDGEVALAGRVRSTARARAALVAMAEDAAAGLERPAVAVMTVDDPAAGDDAAAALATRLPDADPAVRSVVSAVLAVHTGPGTLALAVADLPQSVR